MLKEIKDKIGTIRINYSSHTVFGKYAFRFVLWNQTESNLIVHWNTKRKAT